MQFGLKEQNIEKIKTVLSSCPRIERVYLYGSRAKGNYQKGSDIDLALVAPELSLSEMFRIENQLDDLLLPWSIDLVLYNKISNPELMDHISRVGIVIYDKED